MVPRALGVFSTTLPTGLLWIRSGGSAGIVGGIDHDYKPGEAAVIRNGDNLLLEVVAGGDVMDWFCLNAGYDACVSLPLSAPILPMLAKRVAEIPAGDNWIFEPKWDGFRCVVFRDGDEILMQSRDGKPLNRYFPEVVEVLLEQLPERCVLDGEIGDCDEGWAGL